MKNFFFLSLVDIAPFGRIVTRDPTKMAGSRASRTRGFHEDDLFLETELVPSANGTYDLPLRNGIGSIGLQWLNRWPLQELRLELSAGSPRLSNDRIEVQGWRGESTWHGGCVPLEGEITVHGDGIIFRVSSDTVRTPIQKVRWILQVDEPLRAERLLAFNRPRWGSSESIITVENNGFGALREVSVYSGELPGGDLAKRWDLVRPLHLPLRFSYPSVVKSEPAEGTIQLAPAGGKPMEVKVED